jgi:cell division protein FtsW
MTTMQIAPFRGVERISAPDQIEGRLLVLSAAFLLVNTLALWFIRGSVGDWVHLLVWLLCALAGHLWLKRRLPQRDPLLFPLAMFLSGWGMVMIERLAPNFADRQTVWLALGVLTLGIVVVIPNLLILLRRYRYILLITGLVLLITTILLGVNPSGQVGAPRLWLGLGEVFFQPSELLKVILVIFLASYLAEQYPSLQRLREHSSRRFASLSPTVMGPILLMFLISTVVLLWQRDLGTATLFFIVFLLMLYLATGFAWVLVGGFLLVGVAGIIAYQVFAVVRLRVDIWLNPWLEPDGRAYQIVQSLFAFSEGGIFGRGIGQGLPTSIPVVHSDFIFAALAEEWGLIGVISLIAVLVLIITRGFRVASRHSNRPFLSLMAAGLSLLIAIQTLMITGGVLKLIPLTGVTLPFLSYGGSSLVINFMIIGLLLQLSAHEGEHAA